MNFNGVSDVETIEDTCTVLNGLEFYKVGDGPAIDIFIRLYNEFPCFEGSATLDGFKFGYNFAGQLYILPRERVRKIDKLSSGEAMKYAVTGGVVDLDAERSSDR